MRYVLSDVTVRDGSGGWYRPLSGPSWPREQHLTSSTDVLVIGGGIVGAASAYYLSKAGVRVTLLEAETLGYGATGRNLGFIWVHTRKKGP